MFGHIKELIVISLVLLTSCTRDISGVSEDFVFTTGNIEGDEA